MRVDEAKVMVVQLPWPFAPHRHLEVVLGQKFNEDDLALEIGEESTRTSPSSSTPPKMAVCRLEGVGLLALEILSVGSQAIESLGVVE